MTEEEKIGRLVAMSDASLREARAFLAMWQEMQDIDREEAEESRVAYETQRSREGEIRRWGPSGRPSRK